MATLAQAKNRMNRTHRQVLRFVRDIATIHPPGHSTIGDARGRAKAAGTLLKWNAIECVAPGRWSAIGPSVPPVYALTEFGRSLLLAVDPWSDA